MKREASPSIGVVGAGRLGTSLAAALTAAGYRAAAIADRDGEAGQTIVRDCEVVFLTVPDVQIAPVCAALPWRAGQWAVHCSGALGIDVLAPAARAGSATGCLHPIQSFPSRQPEPERFRGIVCGVEASGELGSFLERLAHDLGATTVRLEGVDRALYHAAAVFASNAVVALAAAAERTWALAGLPPETAHAALSPLLLGAASNVAALGTVAALTGPVARGDVATVEGHLRALAADPALLDLYRRLGAELLALPLGLPEDARRRLAALFDARGNRQ